MDKETLLNKYFEGTLTKDEQKVLDDLLSSDTEFTSYFNLQSDLKKALRKRNRKDLKQYFQSINENTKEERQLKPWRIWSLAACAVVLLGAFLWFYKPLHSSSKPDNATLFDTYFEPYENILVPITRGDSINTIEKKAFTAYELEDYSNAMRLFEESIDSTNQDNINFYLAMIEMKLGQSQEAVDRLDNLYDKNTPFKQQINWYLALGYIQLNERQKSLKYLEYLKKANTYKADEARSLLELLK